MSELNIQVEDNIKELILKNEPIEEKLHVIAVVSNPCNYRIRYKLTNEFMARMEKEPNIIVYLVELVYKDQTFEVTSSTNKRHLQIRTDTAPLWHKENMINLGVKYLLPQNWKALAWIDADVEFDSAHWALDTLKLLNGGRDFVQLFSHCIDMDFNKQIMNTFTSFGYQYNKNFKKGQGINYWHPGFAWACNRKAYDKIGGIYQQGILGSGDNIMCHTFIKKAPVSLKKGMSQEYIDFVTNLQNKVQGLTLGYIPGPIRHYFHGKKENRNYYGREDILIRYQYSPYTFIEEDSRGLIIPSANCPKEFLKDIIDYFKDRNEDEMVFEELMSKDKTDKEVLEYKIHFILHEFEKLQKRIGLNEPDVKKATKEIADILSMNNTNTGDTPHIVPVINVKTDLNAKPKLINLSVPSVPVVPSVPSVPSVPVVPSGPTSVPTSVPSVPVVPIVHSVPVVSDDSTETLLNNISQIPGINFYNNSTENNRNLNKSNMPNVYSILKNSNIPTQQRLMQPYQNIVPPYQNIVPPYQNAEYITQGITQQYLNNSQNTQNSNHIKISDYYAKHNTSKKLNLKIKL